SLQCLEACCSFCHVDANRSYLERSRNGIHGLARHLMSQGPGRGAWQRRRQPCPGQTPTSELECALRSLLAHTCTTKCRGCNRRCHCLPELMDESGRAVLHLWAVIWGQCPLMAQSGHHDRANPCPLLGVKRT